MYFVANLIIVSISFASSVSAMDVNDYQRQIASVVVKNWYGCGYKNEKKLFRLLALKQFSKEPIIHGAFSLEDQSKIDVSLALPEFACSRMVTFSNRRCVGVDYPVIVDAGGQVWAIKLQNDLSYMPVKIPGFERIVKIEAGADALFGLDEEGQVWAIVDNLHKAITEEKFEGSVKLSFGDTKVIDLWLSVQTLVALDQNFGLWILPPKTAGAAKKIHENITDKYFDLGSVHHEDCRMFIRVDSRKEPLLWEEEHGENFCSQRPIALPNNSEFSNLTALRYVKEFGESTNTYGIILRECNLAISAVTKTGSGFIYSQQQGSREWILIDNDISQIIACYVDGVVGRRGALVLDTSGLIKRVDDGKIESVLDICGQWSKLKHDNKSSKLNKKLKLYLLIFKRVHKMTGVKLPWVLHNIIINGWLY